MSRPRALRRKKIRESQARLKKRAESEGFLPGQKLIVQETRGRKMSEVLLDFARPYLDLATDSDAERKAIALSAMAWNVALLPLEEHAEKIAKLTSAFPDFADDLKQIMHEMIQRKLLFFPDIRRIVVSYEVIELGGERLHLSVISSLEPQD